MNRPEAEKLLGGYATGILTEAERRTLFAAALEHQELFDALVDEEALRDLLADPETRRKLLALLSQPRVTRLWRRPAFMGLAASLLVLMATGLAVWRFPPQRSVAQAEAGAAPAEASLLDKGQDKGEAASPAPALRQPASPAKPSQRARAKVDAKAASSLAEAAPVAPEALKLAAEKEERADALIMDAARSAKMASAGAMVAEAPLAKKAKGPAAPGVVEKDVTPFRATLEHLQSGRVRLTVDWGPEGHLYVLKRTSEGVAVLTPSDSAEGGAGSHKTRFELALGGQDVVDVYVLAAPVADPGTLPEAGAIQGARRRVYPE